MPEGELADQARLKYAEEVRRDPSNLYFCTRLLERGYMLYGVADGQELIRRAALTVYKFDPLAYVTTFPHATGMLAEADLEELTAALVVDGNEDATNFLRGKLWSDAARGHESGERYARRGLEFLRKVPEATAAAEPDYFGALAYCCLLADYPAYKALARRLVDSREPEWRGHELIQILETAACHADWETYEAWRAEWDQLPVNAHLCECTFNSLYTFDGLRDLEREDLAELPALLRKAVDVRGCPHLNSGAARMQLVEKLIEREVLSEESLAYLDACEAFCADDKRIGPLREKLGRPAA